MRFFCNRDILNAAIATAGRSAASKSPIPALEGLLIEAGVQVRITGYDLKKGIYTGIDAAVEEPGSVVLGARIFGDIVRKLPDGVVSVEVDNNYMATISCGSAEFTVLGSNPEDYPELPEVDYESAVSLGQDALAQMIAGTAFAVSDNESRPVYTGALFQVEGQQLTVVALDGYRLALRRESIDRSDADKLSFIVPGAALTDLERICTGEGEPVQITLGSKHVSFTVGRTVLISRRLEGDFMDYRRAVPGEFKTVLKGKRAELIRSADRVSLVIDDRTKNPLRCTFGEDRVDFSCSTPLGRAEDSCPLEGDGGGMEVGFNNRYLLDALKAAPEEELCICLNGPSNPCVIRAQNGGEDFLYMILPVRLRAD